MTIFEHSSKLWRTVSFYGMALGAMSLAKKNSSFDALNVVLNIPGIRLFYRKFSLTSKAGTNSILVVPTLRVPRSSARRNASPTPALELTMKPISPTPSTSLAFMLLKGPQDFILQLCVPLSKNPLRQCSRLHQNPTGLDFCRSTVVQESKVNEKLCMSPKLVLICALGLKVKWHLELTISQPLKDIKRVCVHMLWIELLR